MTIFGIPDQDASATASAILNSMQSALNANDAASLMGLFDRDAVLVGTAGHCLGQESAREYLTAAVETPGALSWVWRDVVVFHQSPGALGFAGFGNIGKAERALDQGRLAPESGMKRARQYPTAVRSEVCGVIT